MDHPHYCLAWTVIHGPLSEVPEAPQGSGHRLFHYGGSVLCTVEGVGPNAFQVFVHDGTSNWYIFNSPIRIGSLDYASIQRVSSDSGSTSSMGNGRFR